MKKIVIDTNVFIRFFLNDIPEGKQQLEVLLKKAKKEKLILLVPQIIIFEINFVLMKEYKIDKEIVINRLKFLLASSEFTVESKDLFIQAISLYEQKNISLPDCFIFCKAQEQRAELFTFDKKLQKLFANQV